MRTSNKLIEATEHAPLLLIALTCHNRCIYAQCSPPLEIQTNSRMTIPTMHAIPTPKTAKLANPDATKRPKVKSPPATTVHAHPMYCRMTHSRMLSSPFYFQRLEPRTGCFAFSVLTCCT